MMCYAMCYAISFQHEQNLTVVNSKQFHIHSTGDTEKNHDEIDVDDEKVKNPKCKDAAVIHECYDSKVGDNYGELELNRHHADIPDVTESRTDGSMMDVLQKDTKLTDENTAGSNGARITELAVEIKHKEKEKVKKSTLGKKYDRVYDEEKTS
ncbi:Hypothetical predicted protein [Mytilus galloprovincialis]|uniref:Uncharacterized protein n=1 Tax=Mytilus galloprovincialis TaxID=29158 RepID=A0A8B6HDS0_MYTGA|nr:Hypothetical predicted protein [Mytilus galloprovincialis]